MQKFNSVRSGPQTLQWDTMHYKQFQSEVTVSFGK